MRFLFVKIKCEERWTIVKKTISSYDQRGMWKCILKCNNHVFLMMRIPKLESKTESWNWNPYQNHGNWNPYQNPKFGIQTRNYKSKSILEFQNQNQYQNPKIISPYQSPETGIHSRIPKSKSIQESKS